MRRCARSARPRPASRRRSTARRRRRSTSAERSSRRRRRPGPTAARRRRRWRRRRRAGRRRRPPGGRAPSPRPVEVSLWVRAYTSTSSSATIAGMVAGRGGDDHRLVEVRCRRRRRRRTSTRTRRTRGGGCAARRARTWRRPRTPWCRRCRARSPSRRAARTARSARRARSRRAACTGAWRCDVPSTWSMRRRARRAARGRTLDGPHPNRPSAGSRSEGMGNSIGVGSVTVTACQRPGILRSPVAATSVAPPNSTDPRISQT